VGVVVAGLFTVGAAGFLEPKGEEESTSSTSDSSNQIVGFVSIFGEVFSGVLQDMSEELFMLESKFPASLLLGLEGCFWACTSRSSLLSSWSSNWRRPI
jgi:hypothetical protein